MMQGMSLQYVQSFTSMKPIISFTSFGIQLATLYLSTWTEAIIEDVIFVFWFMI